MMAQRIAFLNPFKPRIRKPFPFHVLVLKGVTAHLQSLNLSPAKSVTVRFDPFHEKTQSIRDFIFYTSASKYRDTNPKCAFKIDICNDRTSPQIKVVLESNRELLFKTENLDIVELFEQFNIHISSLYKPKDQPSVEPVVAKSKEKLKSKHGKKNK